MCKWISVNVSVCANEMLCQMANMCVKINNFECFLFYFFDNDKKTVQKQIKCVIRMSASTSVNTVWLWLWCGQRALSCLVNEFRFDIRCSFLLPGNVVESKRNPLSFRFLVVTSKPVPAKVAESYEIDDNDDLDESDVDARTRIMRGWAIRFVRFLIIPLLSTVLTVRWLDDKSSILASLSTKPPLSIRS